MKTAEEILKREADERFDLRGACDKAEDFFHSNNAATSSVLVVAKHFINEYDNGNFHGFCAYYDDAITTYMMRPYCKVSLEKAKVTNTNLGVLEVDAPSIREVVKEMRRRGFFARRKDSGIYVIQAE